MSKSWAGSGVDLHLDLDTSGGRRAGLERALRAAIAAGRLAPGATLPSTRALALELGAGAGTTAVAMEEPGHPLHRDTVRHAGLRIVPLPVDDLGARPEALDGAGAAVLTPAHQYPCGATLHPDRRRAFTAWARETGATIIEDDYDGEFRYGRQPVGALQGTAPDHVVYAGTTSKPSRPHSASAGWCFPDASSNPSSRPSVSRTRTPSRSGSSSSPT